jgi:hypothetical protein
MEMKKYIEPSVRVKDVETESLLELASKPQDEVVTEPELSRQQSFWGTDDEEGARKTRSVWDEE